MTLQGPGGEGSPENEDGGAAIPEGVWTRFAHDDERAIAESAPREPSARERAEGARVRTRTDRAGSGGAGAVTGGPGAAGGSGGGGWEPADAVGELWRPEEWRAGPAWRDLDARARRRRIARLLGAAAAVVLLWTVASRAPVGARDGYRPDGSRVEQSEDAPFWVPATPGPTPRVAPSGAAPTRHLG
ncbi:MULTISPECIES: hypothetical protein [unclassified Streptomyces]|uniref:hypothetical protein n=1 Tax=unclassified Streptomyces TaxID=2593676 RepID=UPI0004BE8F61|nr:MULTISPECIES: hypothetical protein [unclassified Streptomyces]